jgi:cellulose synthase/poly-beta-1,6-N-acetylglucosamine synthase-like glycosyltransferase
MIFLEVLIFFSTVLPLFHLFNALLTRRKRAQADVTEHRISILIPCYNEEDTVALSVRGLLQMNYRNYEAIYINDGSNDATLEKLNQLLALKPVPNVKLQGYATLYRSGKQRNIRVIDKRNGGKSSALNAGMKIAGAEIVVTLDADSVLHRDALKVISNAFEDSNVVAAGGTIHIMQGYDPAFYTRRYPVMRKILVSLQMMEYIKGFYVYKLSLAKQNAISIISGAFGAFRRSALLATGGYRRTLGEDIDITMRIQKMIHNTAMKVLYLPEALCYTQCPENWHDLLRQRLRWQKGFVDCTVHHRKFLLRTFLYKSLSFHYLVEAFVIGQCSCLFTALNYLLVIALALTCPVTLHTFLFYFLLCVALNLLYTLGAVFVSERYHRYPRGAWKRKLLAVLLDVLFYRYFNLITYTVGTLAYFWNRRDARWNKVARSKSYEYASDV